MKLDKWTVILVAFLTIALIIVFLGVKYGWFERNDKLNRVAGEGSVKEDDKGNVSSEYARIAKYAHNQLWGTNWNIGSDVAWHDVVAQLYELNNNELRVVANEYERQFPDDGTLRQLLKNEWKGCGASSFYTDPNAPCYQYYHVMDILSNINA